MQLNLLKSNSLQIKVESTTLQMQVFDWLHIWSLHKALPSASYHAKLDMRWKKGRKSINIGKPWKLSNLFNLIKMRWREGRNYINISKPLKLFILKMIVFTKLASGSKTLQLWYSEHPQRPNCWIPNLELDQLKNSSNSIVLSTPTKIPNPIPNFI